MKYLSSSLTHVEKVLLENWQSHFSCSIKHLCKACHDWHFSELENVCDLIGCPSPALSASELDPLFEILEVADDRTRASHVIPTITCQLWALVRKRAREGLEGLWSWKKFPQD